MENTDDMRARHAATLAELNTLGLAMARDLAQREQAAETAKDAAQLAGAFHKITRSLRQTMALEDKLRRDADRTRPSEPTPPRPQTRYDRIHAAVSRLIWDEYEDDEDEAQDLEDQLDDILEQDFPDIPETDIIAQIAEHLGLSDPSPLAGKGGARSATDEGSHEDLHRNGLSARADSGEQPLIRPADAAHLLPQGEKEPAPAPDPGSIRASWYDIYCGPSPDFGQPKFIRGERPPWEEPG